MMVDNRRPLEFLSSLRSTDRNMTDAAQQNTARRDAVLKAAGGGSPASAGGDVGSYQNYARQKLAERGMGDQGNIQALINLWQKESGWNPNALNKSSGAHGITQMMPMHGRREGAQAQIDWGIDYILRRYGNPLRAWQHSQKTNWY